MQTEWRYEPIEETLAMWKGQLVTVTNSTGQWVLFDLKGKYITNFSNTRKIHWIGKIIKPRWREWWLTWKPGYKTTVRKPNDITRRK